MELVVPENGNNWLGWKLDTHVNQQLASIAAGKG